MALARTLRLKTASLDSGVWHVVHDVKQVSGSRGSHILKIRGIVGTRASSLSCAWLTAARYIWLGQASSILQTVISGLYIPLISKAA
ncbi:hypothetical protein N3K66_005308 [Trichothecium roseum]|uniref:Uncharacterized protein n=1 Tax=Trichothecium roseum TaxID=47278 RepID=A0ACC0UZE0_9HYPO|nr:hypothetical protein N3K66_005308 [Trichothecium roseum]